MKQKDTATGRPYSLRYIGSLVADLHRTLLYGGVFLYPADCTDPQKPKSKLRLLYEVAPMAFIMEQAGGTATTGTQRTLDIQATSLHDRVPIVMGSSAQISGPIPASARYGTLGARILEVTACRSNVTIRSGFYVLFLMTNPSP